MEGLVMADPGRQNGVNALVDQNSWNGRRVFITGHTGFKGAWLCLWLSSLGARVTGFALDPPTNPSLFNLCKIDQLVKSVIGDVRDMDSLGQAMRAAAPEVVIHLAAQSLVRDSYKIPLETYSINVMGTVNLFEAVRGCGSVRGIVNVTTDKCYENKEWVWGYRECEPMGGYDPYSNSKACSELITAAYRSSYFNPENYTAHGIGLASARAGNVIGGGDWAVDRLIPDCIRSLLNGESIVVRNPMSIRPWQHVLEPLSGYIILAQKLIEDGSRYAEAWNFGPADDDAKPVEWVVQRLCSKWGENATYVFGRERQPHEAHCLKLDCSKAGAKLGWHPRWNLEQTIDSIIEWTHAYRGGADLREVCMQQINNYSNDGELK